MGGTMSITLNGTTGITTPDLTSAAPMDVGGSAVLTAASSLAAANLTGALPAISGAALTGVGASTDYGAVGTYAFLYFNGAGITEGVTVAGSGLYPAGLWSQLAVSVDSVSGGFTSRGGTALSGTWRCMGRNNYEDTPVVPYSRTNVYVRIS